MKKELSYYHDDVTGTCVVKLDDFHTELMNIAKKINESDSNTLIRLGYGDVVDMIHSYPNSYTGKATFNFQDDAIEKYDINYGFDIARARLLTKVNKAKANFTYRLYKKMCSKLNTVENIAKYYGNRSIQYENNVKQMKDEY